MSKKSRAKRAEKKPRTIAADVSKVLGDNAKKACRKCYGRGYEGLFVGVNTVYPCRCIVNRAKRDKVFEEKMTGLFKATSMVA